MQPTSAKKLLAGLAPDAQLTNEMITAVITDSRQIVAGCVFVAFPGEHFDGHDFAVKAIAQGAVYVVVNYPVQGVSAQQQIVCAESYSAMLCIGANYRSQFTPTVIGVTGSAGKTTTKEFCAAVFGAFGETLKTQGNQNNELGVPRTLLNMSAQTEYAVVEMGMNHAGEIERLSCCAQPSAAIITGIGVAHIEHLGSRENIRDAKLEICAGMPEGAPIVLPCEDAYLRGAALPAHLRPVWFSVGDSNADVCASELTSDDTSTQFVLTDALYGCFSVTIPTLGVHNVCDALAAYSVATRLGLDAATAAHALSQFQQVGMRQRVVKHGAVTVIEDCYNANPDSMAAALAMFKTYPAYQRIALFADMLELGVHSETAHVALGELAAQSGVDYLIAYGAACEQTAASAAKAGLRVLHAQTHRAAADALLAAVKEGDAVLVKGSRSMALEKVLALFYAEYPQN